MDQQLVSEKLESLRRCVSRLGAKCPESLDELISDVDAQDIITLNLTRAVQLCVDIAAHIISENNATAPSTMAQSFSILAKLNIIDESMALNLKKAVGFRNIAVHDYEEIDWNIVNSICKFRLDDFKRYAEKIADLL
jgi:uncharacterized protein YutE (UPF0331/DUF86 family)